MATKKRPVLRRKTPTGAIPHDRDRLIAGRDDIAPEDPDELDKGPDLEVEEDEDGGALVTDASNEPEGGEEFDENLAEVLEETELNLLALDLMRKIEMDKMARSKRDEQYEEGLKRTGLGEEAPGGASFRGASRVAHPMLTEACIDFHAAAMKEIFPAAGPVRTKIIGEQTPEQLKVADRQFQYMNWQLTEQIEEFREELSVTITQLPMGGSQYMKFWDDEVYKRPRAEFAPVDEVIVPYKCRSFWSAHRITHVMTLSDDEFDERVDSEMYRDLKLAPPAEMPETTKTEKANEKIEGVEDTIENLDGYRLIYEVNTYLKLSADDDERLPYLITIDERSNRVLSIYRNWDENDQKKERLHWIVDFGFIPWRGAIKLGLAQILGGLSGAATGALRALLDSALVQTIPVLAKLKTQKFGAQSKTADPMSVFEVEVGTGVDDIRKALMALPFNPPSPVLYALLGWLSEQSKGVVTTAEEKIADAGNNMPVGTALALMESGAKVFSTIHSGLHHSMAKVLKVLARFNKYEIDLESQKEKFGEIICTAEDFRKPLGVIPVSDPNIFSEGQRFAQMQAVMSYALGMDPKTQQPTITAKLHNTYKVLRTFYERMKIPDHVIEELLPAPKEPSELNAAAENTSVMLGNPIMPFPEQDHLAHLETHLRWVLDPMFGGNPSVVPVAWPLMIDHIKGHLAFLYAKAMHDLVSEALGQDLSLVIKDKSKWGQIDQLIAAASKMVHDRLQHMLQPLGPILNQMIQKIEAMKPPPPMDPSQASLKIATMEDERAKAQHKDDVQLSKEELEAKKKKDEADAAAKARDAQIKDKQVSGQLGEARDKTLIAAADQSQRHAHEAHRAVLDTEAHVREGAHGAHEALLGAKDQVHQHGLDQRDQSHRHSLERQGAARDDFAAASAHAGSIEDRRLAQAKAADDSARAADDQRLREGGELHSRTMDVLGHGAETQRDEHTRRMGEADLAQRKREEDNRKREAEAARKDEAKRLEAERKAADKGEKK